MSSVVTELTDCLNCGTPLEGAFCSKCGQKAGNPNPTFHHLLHELGHELLHVDGRLWSSLRLLFTRPGFLTREYIAGHRAPYLTPLRLYLICSVVFFAVSAYTPGVAVNLEPGRGRTVNIEGLKISGEVLLRDLPDEEIVDRVQRAAHDWLPRFTFALIPVWALLVKLVTWREKRNFPEHIYFALHVQGAFYTLRAVGSLMQIPQSETLSAVWGFITLAAVIWYLTVALRTVYGGSIPLALRRTASLMGMYLFVVIVAFGAFFSIAIRG
jgi:hypothetical protein